MLLRAALGAAAALALAAAPAGAQKAEGLAMTPPMGWSSWNNRSDEAQRITIDWARAELRHDMHQRDPAFATRTNTLPDAWTRTVEGTTAEPLVRRVALRDTLVVTLTPGA